MAIVTASMQKELNSRKDAWFQVIDDINESNIANIRYIVEQSDIVIKDKFSNPVLKNDIENNNDKIIIELIDKAKKFIQNNMKLGDTQFKNIIYKFKYWALTDFRELINKLSRDNAYVYSVFVQRDKLSTHEWLFLETINLLGVNILVATKDFSTLNYTNSRAQVFKFNTNENLKVDANKKQTQDRTSSILFLAEQSRKRQTEKSHFNSLTSFGAFGDSGKSTGIDHAEISKEDLIDNKLLNMLNNHVILRLSIAGTEANIDTLTIAAKVKNICKEDDKSFFIENRISTPTIDETSKIYKLTKDDINYIIHTMKNFIKCYDKNIENKVKEIYHGVAMGLYTSGDNANIVYNKSVTIICWLNRFLKYDKINFIYYGNPKGNDKILIDILKHLDNVSIVIINAESKTDYYKFDKGNNIELLSDTKNIDLDLVSTDTATTMAYNANKMVDQTLFSGDTVGMYKEGQIIGCNTKHLACTFDEISLWWNKEMFIRPGFEQSKHTVNIPVQFGIIRGVKGDEREYRNIIQKFCCGKTTLYYNRLFYPTFSSNKIDSVRIHNCTDINRTMFSEQKPFIVGGKIQTELIKNGRNYKYGFLDNNKQDFIFSKIQELLDDKMIIIPNEYKNRKQDYYDMMLNIVFNLDIEILRIIQWFNYTDYNPNIVVISNNEQVLTFEDTLYLRFLSKLGFDILVFVPTQYASVENYLNQSEYEIYNIGRPEYNYDTSNINIIKDVNYAQKQEEKKSWLGKLFG